MTATDAHPDASPTPSRHGSKRESKGAARKRRIVEVATRMLARSLNMPEPLVHSTGDYVVAQVVAFEHGVGRSLCPFRLARLVRAWWRGRH